MVFTNCQQQAIAPTEGRLWIENLFVVKMARRVPNVLKIPEMSGWSGS
jgi:hypothetical protein